MSEIIIKQDTLTYFETDKELYVQQSAFDASLEVEKTQWCNQMSPAALSDFPICQLGGCLRWEQPAPAYGGDTTSGKK